MRQDNYLIKVGKPDYKHWSKAETWGVNAAAFLLHGIEPDEVRQIRLGEIDVPVRFRKVQKTYRVLRSIPWAQH